MASERTNQIRSFRQAQELFRFAKATVIDIRRHTSFDLLETLQFGDLYQLPDGRKFWLNGYTASDVAGFLRGEKTSKGIAK